MKAMLEEILARWKNIEVTGPAKFARSNKHGIIESGPVRFDRRGPRSAADDPRPRRAATVAGFERSVPRRAPFRRSPAQRSRREILEPGR